MSEDVPLSRDARDALRAFGEATHTSRVSDAALQRAWARTRGLSAWQLALAFTAAGAVGALGAAVVLSYLRPPPPPAMAVIAASPGAVLHDEGGRWVLTRGSVRLTVRGTRQTVKTAELEVATLGARVLVEAIEGRTLLFVEEGTVTWRDERGEHVATAGTRVEAPPAAAGATVEAERGRLEDETSLYEEGLRDHEAGRLDAAMAHFREHRRRFPAGVFAPEACVALMLEARALGQLDEARKQADEFLQDFGSDPRAREVAEWREQLR